MSWKEYIDKTKDKPASTLLKEALTQITNKDYVLDLGAGSLRDTKYLVEFGFKNIDVVDSSPETALIAKTLHSKIIKVHTLTFTDFEYTKNKYDLISAQYSLPFNGKEDFFTMWNRLIKSLKPGGIFVGQFFGERDEWKNDKNLIFHKNREIEDMFKDFVFIKKIEEKGIRATALAADKYWHVFHIIAKKN